MNREIKFRGKGIEDNEWYYGDLIQVESGRVHYFIIQDYEIKEERIKLNTCASPEVVPETVGQHTGFYDRFGNEIYEEDIVYVRSEDENAIIEWDDITARFILHFDDWIADFDNYHGKELEVMGDTYNNPELLGGE